MQFENGNASVSGVDMTKKDDPKPISGQLYPKDEPLPTERTNRNRPPSTLSVLERVRLRAYRKSAEAMSALEEAEARYEAARLTRMENYERAALQSRRLMPDNLEKIANAEEASIQAELEEAQRRVEAAKAAHERQAMQDEVEDMELELKLRELKKRFDPEPETKRTRKQYRKPDRENRARAEAENIKAYGSTGLHGKIANEEIEKLRSEFGPDEDGWPDEAREAAYRLRRWALEKDGAR